MNGRICRGGGATDRDARPGAGRAARGLRSGYLGLLGGAIMTCLCLAATGATAGFYVDLGTGLLFSEDSDTGVPPIETYPYPFEGTGTDDRGTGFTGAVGYRFAGGLRVEGELSYREHDFGGVAAREPGGLAEDPSAGPRRDPAAPDGPRGTHPADRDLSSVTLTVNLFRDFDLGPGLKPYIGGGVGLSRISMAARAAGGRTADDRDTVFAYRFGAGLGYEVGGPRGRPAILSLDFRHFATADPSFEASATGPPSDAEIGGTYMGVGLRIGF